MAVTTAPHLPAGRLRGAGSCGSCRAAGHTRGLGLGKQYMAARGRARRGRGALCPASVFWDARKAAKPCWVRPNYLANS